MSAGAGTAQPSFAAALFARDFHALRLLLAEGAAPNASLNGLDSRPLHVAAMLGDLEAAALLLECGGSVDATDALGRTALHWAAGSRRSAMCRLLVGYGAARSVRARSGARPIELYLSAAGAHPLPDLVQFLSTDSGGPESGSDA